MPTVNLGHVTETNTAHAVTAQHSVTLGHVTEGDTAHRMTALTGGAREAVEYVYMNVGWDGGTPTMEGVDYAYMNVGVDLTPTREGVDYTYMNLDDAATPPPGRLIALIPNHGSELDPFTIRGLGLGATQSERSSDPQLEGVSMGVSSWTNVAATYTPGNQFIDEDAGTTNMEHQDVDVAVPVGGESGDVVIETDDGT